MRSPHLVKDLTVALTVPTGHEMLSTFLGSLRRGDEPRTVGSMAHLYTSLVVAGLEVHFQGTGADVLVGDDGEES